MLVTPDDNTSVAVKLGVVYLGTVCGKHKYTLLEEDDIEFVRKHTLEARVEIDRDGTGACVYAVAKSKNDGTVSYFHRMLWINRYRHIPANCVVVHKNGITVDNRLSNLELLEIDPVMKVPSAPAISPEEVERRAQSGDIYRLAISRLPSFDTRHQMIGDRCLMMDADGTELHHIHPDLPFYECRSAACCEVEDPSKPFVRCTLCNEAKYCSIICRELDSKRHKRECLRRHMPDADASGQCASCVR